MEIEVVRALPRRALPDVICRFKNLAWAGRAAGREEEKGGEKRAMTVSGEGSSVVLTLDIAGYKNLEPDEARRVAGGAGVKHARKAGGSELVWSLEGGATVEQFRQLVTGALLAVYRFDAYKGSRRKKDEDRKRPRRLTIVAGRDAAGLTAELPRLRIIDEAVSLARDLSNTPANDLVPGDLAAVARRVARERGLRLRLMPAAQLKRQGFAGLTAVGGGSRHPPVLFALSYAPRRARRGVRPLCLIGKGITFDSGGISIKPSEGMWDMKSDMSGAAAVIGAVQAIAALRLPLPVIGVVAAAENMPSGAAYRPGDILRYRNGRTVEIRSTDAEGRLILADALLFAQDVLKQRRIVEFSTLTGACLRALGHQMSGLFSRSPELAEAVKRAALASGEPVWELPLFCEYRALIDSPVADIRNSGGPLAGAQSAAFFLHEFVDDETEFVHVDIAGTYITEKDDKYWSNVGATGVGVRMAVALAEAEAGRS